jgi:hypothetical protein
MTDKTKGATGPHTVAREAKLLTLMDELRPALSVVEDAKGIVKKAQEAYGLVRAKAELEGFTLAVLDKALKAERQPKNRGGQLQLANEEYFVFKTLGLPVAVPQGELKFDSDEARDEAYWRDQGYQAGIRGDAATPPDECPPAFHQTWLNRRADGAEYSAWGKSEAGAKPDQGGPRGNVITTIDAARAARAASSAPADPKPPEEGGEGGDGEGEGDTGEPDPPEPEAKAARRSTRPRGALAGDPLLNA